MIDQVGKKLLQGAKEWILAHPKNFDPAIPYTDETVSIPAWIAVRSGWSLMDDPEDQAAGHVQCVQWGDETKADVEEITGLMLTISPGLFDPSTWPESYAKCHATAVRRRRPKERAKATARLLQAVIEGKVILGDCRVVER